MFYSFGTSFSIQSVCVVLFLASILTGHLITADGGPNVRLPARFGKRADEEAGNVNLLKLMVRSGEIASDTNRQSINDRQLMPSYQSNPSYVSAALPPQVFMLVPVSVDHKASQQYRDLNELASKRNGPNWL